MRILLIDDDDSVRTCLQVMLQYLDYECVASAGGEEVFQLMQAQPFDLVVTDVDMPFVTGIEIVTRCAVYHPGLPIIVMSGGSVPTALPPDTPFLVKPFALADFTRVVNKLTKLPRS